MKNLKLLEASAWLAKAGDDLKYAKANFQSGFYDLVCFLTEQIAEKALKSFLIFHGVTQKRYKVHQLPQLIFMCTKFDSSFKDFLESAQILNRYYIPTRYPSFPEQIGTFDEKRAWRAIELAEELMNFVKKKI